MSNPATVERGRRASVIPIWAGVLISIAGLLSYFLFFVRFPALRDFPWLNLPLVLLGLCLSLLGIRNAFHASRGWPAKLAASLGLLLSLAAVALFSSYIFYLSYQMPAGLEAAEVNSAAPSFELPDEDGTLLQLADFRGKKVVLSFYRGHW